MILEFLRFELPSLGVHDVDREVDHVLWNLLVVDSIEVLLGLADLVGIPQRHADHALVARLEHNDMFAGGEDDLAECHHPFLADRLSDHRERLLSDFAIWNDVVWIAQVEFVDLSLRDELINFDDALAFNRDVLELLWFKLYVFAFCNLVSTSSPVSPSTFL